MLGMEGAGLIDVRAYPLLTCGPLACYQGVEWIDAEVTVFHTSARDGEVALCADAHPLLRIHNDGR